MSNNLDMRISTDHFRKIDENSPIDINDFIKKIKTNNNFLDLVEHVVNFETHYIKPTIIPLLADLLEDRADYYLSKDLLHQLAIQWMNSEEDKFLARLLINKYTYINDFVESFNFSHKCIYVYNLIKVISNIHEECDVSLKFNIKCNRECKEEDEENNSDQYDYSVKFEGKPCEIINKITSCYKLSHLCQIENFEIDEINSTADIWFCYFTTDKFK